MITLLALPTIWLVNRDEDGPASSRPNVAAVGLDPGEADDQAQSAPVAEFDPMGAPGAMYLESASPMQPVNTAVVVVGTSGDVLVSTARGSYRRSVASEICLFNGLPGGEQVTVVNVANRRSTQCTTSPLAGGDTGVLILSPSRFQRIADLTAAPIHLEIRQ